MASRSSGGGVAFPIEPPPRPAPAAKDGTQRIDGRDASPEDVDAYLPTLLAELNLYPAGLLKQAGIRRVLLCEGLTRGGRRVGGLARVLAGDLYLDVIGVRWDNHSGRAVIHHEVFHAIDTSDDRKQDDPAWTALNADGFRYRADGADPRPDPRDDLVGFVTRYAMSGVMEDKAESFSSMMVDGRWVEARTRRDGVLRAKADRMKALLRAFAPGLDDSFWDATRELSR